MRSGQSDLYFILNPALGIIKIGIAGDVDDRRRTLQHACGVELEVLAVLPKGEQYEKPLHMTFMPSRLHGEWFNPTAELLALIDTPERVPAFLKEMAPRIEQNERDREQNEERKRAERLEASRAEREELQRIRDKEMELRSKREATKARRAERERDAAARQKAEHDQRVAQERSAWLNHNPELVSRVLRPDAAREAVKRRAEIGEFQRTRNAAMLGVAPEPVGRSNV